MEEIIGILIGFRTFVQERKDKTGSFEKHCLFVRTDNGIKKFYPISSACIKLKVGSKITVIQEPNKENKKYMNVTFASC